MKIKEKATLITVDFKKRKIISKSPTIKAPPQTSHNKRRRTFLKGGASSLTLFIGVNPGQLFGPQCDNEPMYSKSASGKVFHKWIEDLTLREDEYKVVNLIDRVTEGNRPLKASDITEAEFHIICEHIRNADKIVALGSAVSKFLEDHNVEHFKLPHPSPRNRQLNDKEFIKNELKACREYINPDIRIISI